MKTAVYYRPNGVIVQVAFGPAGAVTHDDLPGLEKLVVDGYVDVDGKVVVDGAIVDGVVDERTPTDKLHEIQARAQAMLLASDWVTARAYDTGEPVPEKWRVYRDALRAVMRMTEYRDVTLPNPPA